MCGGEGGGVCVCVCWEEGNLVLVHWSIKKHK